jgi:5-carboxyvanillate decarboxylase
MQTLRTIAVEEHFATSDYWRRTSRSAPFAGEGDELAWTRAVMADVAMEWRLTDVDAHILEMDDSGVDLSLLSLNPPGVQLWRDTALATGLARDMNDVLADLVAAHPARLGGLAAVAPQDPPAAAAEIQRAVGPLGLHGVLIASHTGGTYLDQPEAEPVLSALTDAGAALYLHPRMPSPQMLDPFRSHGLEQALWGFQAEASTHALRLIMSGTLDRHPDLRIVLGHLGEGLPFWLWRLDNLYGKMYSWGRELLGMTTLELTPSEYFLRNFSVTTSGMFDELVLDYCVRKLGADRVLFAIDYPYEDIGIAARFLADADLTEDQRALVSHRNAERVFRLAGPA